MKNLKIIIPAAVAILALIAAIIIALTPSKADPVESMANLEKLELIGCYNIEDISPIKDIKELRKLNIFQCPKINNINVISSLTDLNVLRIGESPCEVTDYIASFNNLERLDLDPIYYDKVNIEILKKANYLKYLRLGVIQKTEEQMKELSDTLTNALPNCEVRIGEG